MTELDVNLGFTMNELVANRRLAADLNQQNLTVGPGPREFATQLGIWCTILGRYEVRIEYGETASRSEEILDALRRAMRPTHIVAGYNTRRWQKRFP